MKTIAICVLLSCFLAGCAEYAGGFATGAAAMKKVMDDSQDRFFEAVDNLNEETAKINAGVKGIEGTILVKPETLDAIKGLKGREKDPVTWIALASIFANAFFGGKGYASRKATQ